MLDYNPQNQYNLFQPRVVITNEVDFKHRGHVEGTFEILFRSMPMPLNMCIVESTVL